MRILILINLLMPFFIGSQKRASTSPLLNRPVYVEQRRLAIEESFRAALGSAGVPGGVITVNGCGEKQLIKQRASEGEPLGQYLNELVAAEPAYRWELLDAAVNLVPSTGEPVLLQTYIGKFDVRTDSSITALDQLQSRPEITSAMQNLHLKGGLSIVMYLSNSKQIDLHFKGGTMRQALNAIAVSKGRDVWDYRETHCGERNEVTISF